MATPSASPANISWSPIGIREGDDAGDRRVPGPQEQAFGSHSVENIPPAR